jgi:hypothetical protein
MLARPARDELPPIEPCFLTWSQPLDGRHGLTADTGAEHRRWRPGIGRPAIVCRGALRLNGVGDGAVAALRQCLGLGLVGAEVVIIAPGLIVRLRLDGLVPDARFQLVEVVRATGVSLRRQGKQRDSRDPISAHVFSLKVLGRPENEREAPGLVPEPSRRGAT